MPALPLDLPLTTTTDHGVRFETGRPVTFPFIRNTEKAPRRLRGLPDRFQQGIEPAGVYLLVGSGHVPPGWVTGTVTSRKPLVLLLNSAESPDSIYDDASWKAVLHRAFKAKGKALSAKLMRLGYDLIVTVSQGETREVVALDPAIVAFDEALKAAAGSLERALKALDSALIRADVRKWAATVAEDLGLGAFEVYEQRDGMWRLQMLAVPKGSRRQGLGSQAMERLVSHADEQRKTISLSRRCPTTGGEQPRAHASYGSTRASASSRTRAATGTSRSPMACIVFLAPRVLLVEQL